MKKWKRPVGLGRRESFWCENRVYNGNGKKKVEKQVLQSWTRKKENAVILVIAFAEKRCLSLCKVSVVLQKRSRKQLTNEFWIHGRQNLSSRYQKKGRVGSFWLFEFLLFLLRLLVLCLFLLFIICCLVGNCFFFFCF